MRWNANTLVLVIFSCVLLGAGLDYGRRIFSAPKPEVVTPDKAPEPPGKQAPFKVGEIGTDFTLPDSKKVNHKFSDLAKKGDTMLFFACGCSNCRKLQEWIAESYSTKKATNRYSVVTVTSAAPESEAAWKRDIKLPQQMLFTIEGSHVMETYQGKPCPRVYLMDKNRKIEWISQSMMGVPSVEAIGIDVLKKLGVKKPSIAPPGMPTLPQGASELRMGVPKNDATLPPYAQPQNVATP